MTDKYRAVSRLGRFGPERERIVREYASGSPLRTFADEASGEKDRKEEIIIERSGDKNEDQR